jgi:hypothetical protein
MLCCHATPLIAVLPPPLLDASAITFHFRFCRR